MSTIPIGVFSRSAARAYAASAAFRAWLKDPSGVEEGVGLALASALSDAHLALVKAYWDLPNQAGVP
jgi:hypothetical protein